MALGIDILVLLASLGLILLASVLFTNGIELFGHRLGMHQGATGSILAAIGTALPETVIPIIAIIMFRDEQAKDIAVGAIVGAPFMLGTLAFFITGLAVLVYAAAGRRPLRMRLDNKVLARDLAYFVLVYGLAVLATFVDDVLASGAAITAVKIAICAVLLSAYVLYLKRTLASPAAKVDGAQPLHFSRLLRGGHGTRLIVIQLIVSLAVMLGGAHLFVRYVEDVSITLGVPALVLSLIITPIATELPEKFNSVLWIRKGKDVLAMGNITGAMTFQGCIPVVVGILFTRWDLLAGGGITMASAVIALGSATITFLCVKAFKRLNPFILLVGGLLYAAFIVYMVLRWDVLSRPVVH